MPGTRREIDSIGVKLPLEVKKALMDIAWKRHTTISELIRQAIVAQFQHVPAAGLMPEGWLIKGAVTSVEHLLPFRQVRGAVAEAVARGLAHVEGYGWMAELDHKLELLDKPRRGRDWHLVLIRDKTLTDEE